MSINAPWFVIPADDKDMARVIVAQIIWEEMQKLTDVKEPKLDEKVRANFAQYRKQLEK